MKVSVVMAVHNGLPYLEEALSSVFSQTFKDLAVIAVDDGSTDGSLEYLRKVTDSRLRVAAVKNRGGQGLARNIGIGLSNSQYVAFMDADDVSFPRRLERQVEYLDRNSNIGAVGTLVSYYTDSGRAGFAPPLALDHDSIRRDLIAGKHAIVNATLMIRAEVLKRLKGYRIAGCGEDWDLFLRLTEATRVANLNEILYFYRLRPQSTNFLQARLTHLRIAHACDCARRRFADQEEITFEEFSVQRSRRPFWNRWLDMMDQLAATKYRTAMAEILNKHQVVGYARFLIAAAISPKRVLQRAGRAVRYLRRSPSRPRASANGT
jgi:glycosyltransferase involved in cell wall biosynthesis